MRATLRGALLLLFQQRGEAVFATAPAVADDEGGTPTAAPGPYFLLQPSSFAEVLGDDLAWATDNIPLFESANSTLDLVYYFRWRTYKSHIHPTNCSAVVLSSFLAFAPDFFGFLLEIQESWGIRVASRPSRAAAR